MRAVSSANEISVWSVPVDFTIADSNNTPLKESKLLPILTSTIRSRQIVDEVAADQVRNRTVDHDQEAVESKSVPLDAGNSSSEADDLTVAKALMESTLLWYGDV